MTTRSRSLPWLVAAALASVPSPSRGQDTPLYRDPNPAEGPRIEGPLLPPSPPKPGATPPPPPSDLGPFQPSNPAFSEAAPEVPRDPLLGVPPMPPPMAAMPMPPMSAGGDVQIKRKTTIRPPNGPIGRCHEWFHAALFGPRKDPVATTAPKRGLFGWSSHAMPPEEDAPPRPFKWAWPAWPLRDGH